MPHSSIKIDLLKNHPSAVPKLVNIWHELVGQVWCPEVQVESMIELFNTHLNSDVLPLTFVAIDENTNEPVGMASLRKDECVRQDLTPWLGSLVVHKQYQKYGIAKNLINSIKAKARQMQYNKLYLIAINATIPEYYESIGWHVVSFEPHKEYLGVVMGIDL